MSASLQKKANTSRGPLKFIIFLFTVLVIVGVFFYGQLGAVQPESNDENQFTIKNGSTPALIARNLEEQGLIKDAKSFLLYARLSGNIEKFKAGHYIIKPSLNVPEITKLLMEGRVATQTFTIPEGYHLRQIAEVLEKKGIAKKEEFWHSVKEGDFDYSFIKDLPKDEARLEGYLFPDTYTIAIGMKVDKVLDIMLKRFEEVYEKLPANETGLSMHQIVTLASIVEGEALLDKERPIIASVFHNRLKKNMKLDSCATIQYLFDERKAQILYEDLEIKSPYNTYKNGGLPPGPIGSPGESSLKAVLAPANTKYLYFVAKKDNSGEHVFSTSLQGHNNNKIKLGY